MRCSDFFRPFYDRLREMLLEKTVIQADETTLNLLKEDKATYYMCLYVTGTPKNQDIPNIVLYDYQRSRAGQCAVDFLDDLAGC